MASKKAVYISSIPTEQWTVSNPRHRGWINLANTGQGWKDALNWNSLENALDAHPCRERALQSERYMKNLSTSFKIKNPVLADVKSMIQRTNYLELVEEKDWHTSQRCVLQSRLGWDARVCPYHIFYYSLKDLLSCLTVEPWAAMWIFRDREVQYIGALGNKLTLTP